MEKTLSEMYADRSIMLVYEIVKRELVKGVKKGQNFTKLLSEYKQFKKNQVQHFRFDPHIPTSFGKYISWAIKIKTNQTPGEKVPPSILQLVQIYFDTATFDNIERDKKIKTEAQLSLIGGTMGLLTGFSIISGIEIIFFLFRLVNFTNSMVNLTVAHLRIGHFIID